MNTRAGRGAQNIEDALRIVASMRKENNPPTDNVEKIAKKFEGEIPIKVIDKSDKEILQALEIAAAKNREARMKLGSDSSIEEILEVALRKS